MRSRALRGLASSAEPRPLLEILGLASCAPWVQVRATYISAAMLTHPDRSSLPDASARMAELQQAWERYKRYAHRDERGRVGEYSELDKPKTDLRDKDTSLRR